MMIRQRAIVLPFAGRSLDGRPLWFDREASSMEQNGAVVLTRNGVVLLNRDHGKKTCFEAKPDLELVACYTSYI